MKRAYGFTIVELLIVIVVVAILAALSYVGYTSINNRAHDSAVQADLRQLSQNISLYYAERDVYPTTLAQIRTYGIIAVSKDSYADFFDGTSSYNYLYCWNNTTKKFALAARSRSGGHFQYRDGRVSPYTGSATLGSASVTICSNLGVDDPSRIWLYDTGAWRV